jgi:hypothetical protein
VTDRTSEKPTNVGNEPVRNAPLEFLHGFESFNFEQPCVTAFNAQDIAKPERV